MTLDEAIEHADERACGNDQCAKDHAQLADWLRELREARLTIELLKIFRDGWMEDAQKYKAENGQMRNLLQQEYEFMVHLNETEAYPSSADLVMQRWLLLNEAGIEADA